MTQPLLHKTKFVVLPSVMPSCSRAWQWLRSTSTNDIICVFDSLWPGYGSSDCTACPIGTYSTGGSHNPCTPCPGETTTLAVGAIAEGFCTCPAGYGQQTPAPAAHGAKAKAGGASCTVCPANYWSTPLPTSSGLPDSSCQHCHGNRVSPAGSISIGACGELLVSTACAVWTLDGS